MLAQVLARQRREPRGGDLYDRIGAFLTAQGLAPEPANYALAHGLLTCGDATARKAIDRLVDDGVRLSREELASLGIAPAPGPAPEPPRGGGETRDTRRDEAVDRLVTQTREQVDAVAGMMRAMHDETRGFGRDLSRSAAAFGTAAAAPAEVVRLTRAMIARAADAEARLADAATEADALRAELAEAQACARADPLTGLPNRRAFDEAFDRLDDTAGACLAVVDIDRFKRINDGFGHAVGDRVLGAVATQLAQTCRGHLVTRQGGEEFAVLLAGTDRADAARLLDAAREAVGARRFRSRETDAAIGRVTFSAGVVSVAPGESAAAALARADRLLYRAKEEGRDRVVAG